MENENLDIQKEYDFTWRDIVYTLRDILKTAKRNIFVFIIVILICTVGYSGYTYMFEKPMYRTSATFSITPLVSGDAENGTSVYKFNYVTSFAKQMSDTFPYVAESDNLRQAIAYDIGKSVNADITADPVYNSNIIEVYVESDSANDSYEVMQSFLKTFPKISEYIIGDTRLNIIYESGKPTKPYNDSRLLWSVIIGFIAGLAIDFVIFYIWSMRIDTIHEKSDITYKLNSHCISELPHVNVKRNSKNKTGPSKVAFSDSVFIESARSARKRVQSLIGKSDKVIAITSTARFEGKTVTAFSLAKAFSSNGYRTLLIDMNFTNRDLQKYLLKAPDSCVGISNYAASNVDFESVAKHYKKHFYIAFAGSKNAKYSHPKFKEFFNKAREEYDYIIVDMPSCKLVPGAAAVADLCDDILFVEKCESSTVKDIRSALKYVLYSKAKFIGFILNDYTYASSGYGYRYGRYGYGYGYRYGRYRKYGRYGYGYGYANKYSKYFEEDPKEKK